MAVNWFRLLAMGPKAQLVLDAALEKTTRDDTKAEIYWTKRQRVRGSEQEKIDAIIREQFPDSVPALRLDGEKFRSERLQTGKTVPDIIGQDIDGVEFKLSDYRGQIVLLDFWGDW